MSLESVSEALQGVGTVFFVIAYVFLVIPGHMRAPWPAAVEKGKTPLYSAWAGGRLGFAHVAAFQFRLRVYEDFLIVDGWRRTIMPYSNIERVDVIRRIGNYFLEIIHHQKNAPEPFLLTFPDPERAKMLIDARLSSLKTTQV